MLEKDSLISPLIKRRPVCPIGAKDWVLMILMLIHWEHLCYLRIKTRLVQCHNEMTSKY